MCIVVVNAVNMIWFSNKISRRNCYLCRNKIGKILLTLHSR